MAKPSPELGVWLHGRHATTLPDGIERVLPQLEDLWSKRSWRERRREARRA